MVYEGHDEPRRRGGPDPKSVDQPSHHPGAGLTQNGRFIAAVEAFKEGRADAEKVQVYEKLRSGIWAFAGIFRLTDGWQEDSGRRRVFKFRLEVTDSGVEPSAPEKDLDHTRVIPTPVKLEVWARDSGRCVECGRSDNLHFDHVIPYSEGDHRSSRTTSSCFARGHNLSKGARLK